MGRMKDAFNVGGKTLYTFPAEKALDSLPGVQRSALLPPMANSGNADSILVLEGHAEDSALANILRQYGCHRTRLYHVESMPVDGRHNSKIDRPALATLIRKKQLKPETNPVVQGPIHA